ncbi:MAG: DNAase [Pseudomonadales bacterium]|nr:DNAase [Pseudomonadales bacterium]
MSALIDSHCHIDFPQFDADRESILGRCRQKGMSAILVPGVSRSQWARMSATLDQFNDAERFPRLLPAYGLHPCFMGEHEIDHLTNLETQLDTGAVAVGEIGLDTFHGEATYDAQVKLFKAQLAIAAERSLPVIIHSRKTQDQVIKLIRDQGFKSGGIMHAFSGSLQQAQQAVEQGFLIGFGGAATYDRANRLRRILKALPREAIVFETDAPDIPPCFDREHPNSPLNLFRIVEILAEVREDPVEDLLACSTKNVLELLNIAV